MRMERINISNRTRAALARLKAEGVDLGNLTNLAEVRVRGHATIKANADKYAKDIRDIIQEHQTLWNKNTPRYCRCFE